MTMSRRTLTIHFSLASVDIEIVDFKCLTFTSSKVDVCGNSKFTTTTIIRIYLPPNAIKKKKNTFANILQ